MAGDAQGVKNRPKKNALWLEVAAIVLPGAPDADKHIQTRWRSLRDKFRRLCVALKAAHKSGAGAEDTGESDVAWPYFESMLFLKDSIEGRPTSGNMESAQELLLQMSCSQESSTDFGVDTCSMLSDTEVSLSTEHVSRVVTSDTAGNPPRRAPQTPPAAGAVTVAHEDQHHQPPQKKKTRKVLFKQLGNVQKELTSCASKDIDENFAATLAAHMRTVQPEHKVDMQLKLLQVVKDFKTPAQ
ncbi:hypothetical protein MTO96_020862 [Rhipicephalus appendiculatus]